MSAGASIDDILNFWFGPHADSQTMAERQRALWWGKNSAVDADIKARFEATLKAAAAQELDDWADSPTGMLALILLLDQVPRNSYRNTATAFAYDELARHCCHLGLAMGFDQQLPLLQRVFFYLPLEHAEDLDDQEQSLQLFRTLAMQAAKQEPAAKPVFDNFADFARRHHAIIARFDRFPHRNAILARPSTADEAAFLQEPNSSF